MPCRRQSYFYSSWPKMAWWGTYAKILKRNKKEKHNSEPCRFSQTFRHKTPSTHPELAISYYAPLGNHSGLRPLTLRYLTCKQGGMETTPAKEEASPPGIISNITIPDRSCLGTASFVEYYLSVLWVFTLHVCMVF